MALPLKFRTARRDRAAAPEPVLKKPGLVAMLQDRLRQTPFAFVGYALGSTSITTHGNWVLLIPAALLATALSIWGFLSCHVSHCSIRDPWDFFMKAYRLVRGGYFSFENGDPWQLVVAQFAVPLVAAAGAVKLLLDNVRKDMRVAMAQRHRDHAIVCGLGETGRHIVENLRVAGADVVAITLETDDPNALVCERLGVPVLRGDAANAAILRLAGLRRARSLILTCGSDTLNIEVALRRLGERGPGAPMLYVLPEIRSPWLLQLLQTHRSATLGSDAVEIRPFDLYANAARLLLSQPAFLHAAAARSARPHLLLAGLGELGTQIILHAVQVSFAVPGQRLAITVFDQQGDEGRAGLAARFAGIETVADLDFIEANFDSDNPSSWMQVWNRVEQTLSERAAGVATVAAIVALREDKDALHAALQFRERLDRMGELRTPVFVRLREDRELGHFAATLDGGDSPVERLIPFGDLRYLTSPRLLLDQVQDTLARAIHGGYLDTSPRLGSRARQAWATLPERFKRSNRLAADHVPVKLRQIGMRLVEHEAPRLSLSQTDIETLARAEHWRWLVERQLQGWVPGDDDALARRHSDLVEWEELEEPVREQNRALVRDIPRIVAAAGMGIRRERVILAVGQQVEAARRALDGIAPSEQAIVVFDPADAAACALAHWAVETRGARLRVLWRAARGFPELSGDVPGAARLKAAIETSTTPAELGAPLASRAAE